MENTDAVFEAEEHLYPNRHGRQSNDGELAAEIATGGVHISRSQHTLDEADETTALLARDEQDEAADEWPEGKDIESLPWYKRPSILWVLPPFFLTTLAYGGVIPPKVTLMLDLTCRDYMREQTLADPAFYMAPIHYGGAGNDQCQIPEVQARVTSLMLGLTLIGGILSAFVSPHLGVLSDCYGRKLVLVLATLGALCNETISIIAARNPETFPINLFLLGAALDGLSGSFTVCIAVANAYATDCTPPSMRNISFAMFHASLFTGLALGPITAGYIVKWSGQIVTIFYALLAVHLFFDVYVILLVPESLSKKRQLAARDRHSQKQSENVPIVGFVRRAVAPMVQVIKPLRVLWPTGKGTSPALRRNLVLLSSVDTIAFGVAMGTINIILVYGSYMFKWGTFETAQFMSVVNGSRVVFLIIVLPLLTRLFRSRRATKRNSGSDLFDLSLIRAALLFDTIGYLGYTTARTGEVMMASGALAAAGGIGSPTLQAAITKHAPNDRTGELLGAVGLLHALARVVAPIVFSTIYLNTVKAFPQTVFVCLTATFAVAFGISWFVKPNVHWDDIAAAAADPDAEE